MANNIAVGHAALDFDAPLLSLRNVLGIQFSLLRGRAGRGMAIDGRRYLFACVVLDTLPMPSTKRYYPFTSRICLLSRCGAKRTVTAGVWKNDRRTTTAAFLCALAFLPTIVVDLSVLLHRLVSFQLYVAGMRRCSALALVLNALLPAFCLLLPCCFQRLLSLLSSSSTSITCLFCVVW